MVSTPTQIRRPRGGNGVRPEEAAAVSLLKPYLDAKGGASEAKAVMERLGKSAKGDKPAGPLRAYLLAHPGDLWDGEHGIAGYLEPRRGPLALDAASCPPKVLRWLAQHGCIRLDGAVFEALDGKLDELQAALPYIKRGADVAALQVKAASSPRRGP